MSRIDNWATTAVDLIKKKLKDDSDFGNVTYTKDYVRNVLVFNAFVSDAPAYIFFNIEIGQNEFGLTADEVAEKFVQEWKKETEPEDSVSSFRRFVKTGNEIGWD